ncbi:MAG: YeiH family protein [bacterium]
MFEIKKYLSGLILVAVLTTLAVYIQNIPLVKSLSLSAIIIAILLGMLIKNTIGTKEIMNEGIKLCSKKVLRLAIILLGFKLSLLEVSKLGFKAAIIILIITSATLIFTRYLGKKLNISRSLSILIGAGTSICGASAIVAVNAVTKSENEEDVAFAVGIVTIFGTVFMLFYPVLFHVFHINTIFYSLWAGSSIHEVAQVVAAGFAASNQAGTFATVVKLTRVLLIVPVTILLSIRESKRKNSDKFSFKNITIPWFVLMFLGVIIINSLNIIPQNISKSLINIDNYLMTAAMIGLGLETSLSGMKKTGLKPIYLGAISSVFISVFSIIVIFFIK